MKKLIPFICFIIACDKSSPTMKTNVEEIGPINSSTPLPIEVKKEEESKLKQEMVHITGKFCTKVQEKCIHWMDDPSLPYARCLVYEMPVKCVGKKIDMNFYIGKYEEFDENTKLPIGNMSFNLSKAHCEKDGRRLCTEEEWIFAASGEKNLPYPHGYNRYEAECHIETREKKICGDHICDLRKPVDSFPNCKSPFGIISMIGSEDESVEVKPYYAHGIKINNVLKGGHYLHGRSRVRPATFSHANNFSQITIGTRCCADIK